MTEVCLSAFVNITQFRSTDNYSSLSSLNYPFSIHQQITQRGDTFWRGVHFYRSHHTHYLRGRVWLNGGLTKLVVQNKTRETADQPDRTMYSVLGNHQEWLSDWFRCLFVSLNYKSWSLNEARWLWPFYSILFSLQTADKWMNSTNIWWGFILQRFNRLQMILNVPRCPFSC